jgi:hypothetical protein
MFVIASYFHILIILADKAMGHTLWTTKGNNITWAVGDEELEFINLIVTPGSNSTKHFGIIYTAIGVLQLRDDSRVDLIKLFWSKFTPTF